MSEPETPSESPVRKSASLGEIFLTFLIIGATSFGGGVVAYLRNSLVTKKGWLDDEEFMSALEISQALPGLNATNMSVIVGDRLRGPIGAIAAFVGMTLPGSILVFVLGIYYASNNHNSHITSVLSGVAAASVGLLLAITLQLGHKQLEHALDISLVIGTIVLISMVKMPLAYALLILLPLAIFLYRPRKSNPPKPHHPGLDKKPAD